MAESERDEEEMKGSRKWPQPREPIVAFAFGSLNYGHGEDEGARGQHRFYLSRATCSHFRKEEFQFRNCARRRDVSFFSFWSKINCCGFDAKVRNSDKAKHRNEFEGFGTQGKCIASPISWRRVFRRATLSLTSAGQQQPANKNCISLARFASNN